MAPTSPRLSGCGWLPNTWAVTGAAPKLSSLLPKVWHSASDAPGQSDPSGKHRQDGHPANIHPARSLLLEEIQLLLTLFWTHHCHQSLAVKQPSACTVRCLHSILKKYIPHLLQRYAPDTSILWAGSGLGPWMGPSSHVSSIQNKCHETLPFF